MTDALEEQTLARLQALLERREVSAVEIVQAHLGAMERTRDLNLWITETPERALHDAGAADQRRKAGDAPPLCGIPVAVKDLFCTRDIRTTAGSRILEHFVPPYESTTTQRLWQAGAVCLGKTSLDEFAMGSSNETALTGPALNPWRSHDAPGQARSPGGSSGGSAASVAARTACVALGTDTGGSIRQPAALCGVVGVKPTYGRCSRLGVVAFASSLDQPGGFARTVRDAALVLDCITGFDPGDSTSVEMPPTACAAALDQKLASTCRIGIARQYREGLSEDGQALLDRAIDWFRQAGCTLVELDLPMTHHALPAYYIIAPAEASSNLARYDGVRYTSRAPDAGQLEEMYGRTRAAGFGAEVKRRVMIGTWVLSAGYYDAYYLRAARVRRRIREEFDRAFEQVDLLLAATTPDSAFALDREWADPTAMYYNDMYTVPASLAGLPAISVPGGLDAKGLPLGLQLIGRSLDEATLFQGAQLIEDCAGFPATSPLRAPASGQGEGS